MKVETSDALAAADRAIAHAQGNLSINIPDQAARLAYYALFYAAQALIFERTGKTAKTHKGVHKEFHRLVKGDPSFPMSLASQLSKGFRYKEIADYDTAAATTITSIVAHDAILTAQRFVAAVRGALAEPPAAPSA